VKTPSPREARQRGTLNLIAGRRLNLDELDYEVPDVGARRRSGDVMSLPERQSSTAAACRLRRVLMSGRRVGGVGRESRTSASRAVVRDFLARQVPVGAAVE